jgi:hypothetical protein
MRIKKEGLRPFFGPSTIKQPSESPEDPHSTNLLQSYFAARNRIGFTSYLKFTLRVFRPIPNPPGSILWSVN